MAIVEKHRYLGGRAMEHRFRGHQIGLGSHLVEDPGRQPRPGSASYIGVDARAQRAQRLDAVLGPRPLAADPGVLRRRGQAGPQALHRGAGRDGLRRARRAGTTRRCASGWRGTRRDEGVYLVWEAISVLEQITVQAVGALGLGEPVRAQAALRAQAHRRATRSGRWAAGRRCGSAMADAFERSAGRCTSREKVERVLVEDGASGGVRLRGRDERLEADEVVVNAPVWDIPSAVRRRRAAVGPARSASGCSPTTATAPAGSATGSRPRSR